MEANQPESLSEVQAFYTDKTIFITGGSGFLGKSILEKILRSCSTFKKIYLMLRPLKGKDIKSRLENIFESEIFSIVKQQNPEVFKRVVPIKGDLYCPDLGLSNEDRELISRETNIVIHSGASVRFSEPLRTITKINITSVELLLKLARDMSQLQAFVHISSSFANADRLEIKDQFYESPMNYQDLQSLINAIPENLLDKFTPDLLGKFPNTYSFTKNIAEDCVRRLGKDLPVVIFRPALINSSYLEPKPGFNDTLYGVMGLIAGFSMGILRIFIGDKKLPVSIVPLDYCANIATVLAYQVAKDNQQSRNDEIKIYNFSPFNKHLEIGEMIQKCQKRYLKRPSLKTTWKNIVIVCKNEWSFFLLSFFLHFIPGLIMDTGLWISGKKPKVLKLYKTIHKFLYLYAFFFKTKFDIGYKNQLTLWNSLSEADKQRFKFDIGNLDWNDYLDNFLEGIFEFYLKENITVCDAARKRYARLIMYHNILVSFLTIVGLSVIWSLFSPLFF